MHSKLFQGSKKSVSMSFYLVSTIAYMMLCLHSLHWHCVVVFDALGTVVKDPEPALGNPCLAVIAIFGR